MAETVFNEGSIDGTDFRVESDTKTHMFFVDGDTNRIGMGLDSPSTFLELQDSGDTYVTLKAGDSDGNVGFLFDDSGGNQHGFILFDTDDLNLSLDADGVIKLDAGGGQIQFFDDGTEIGVLENSSSDFVIESKVQDKDILFKGNDGGTGIELMRMNMSGANVGISTGNSIGAKLHVADNRSTAYSSTGESAETIIAHNKNGSDGSGVNNYASLAFAVADGATSQGFINYVRTGDNTGYFTFSQRTGSSSYAEHLRLDSDGYVGINTTSPNVIGNTTDGRGILTVGSEDNAGANNYAILELQGHSIANSVGTGGIYFFDHSNNVAIIQADRATSTSSSNILFYTNGGSGITKRMNISSSGNLVLSTSSGTGVGRYMADTTNKITLADEATTSISSTPIMALFVYVHSGSYVGAGGIWGATYKGTTGVIYDDGNCSNADTDGKICVYKSANSHTTTIKNRLGAEATFTIVIYGT